MKKRNMHRIHIGGDIWEWYASDRNLHSLIIFDPKGKRHQITPKKYYMSRGLSEKAADELWSDDVIVYTPAEVKKFILKNLIG